jgi:hypothetical protein
VVMQWTADDGGRADAGFIGEAGDCVARSIAIATGTPYRQVYDALADRSQAKGRPRSARNGMLRDVYEPYLLDLGWTWKPTMQVGQGCTVHLRADELPWGKLIVRVSKHITAVLDHVIFDTADPSRAGTRCVYGYFVQE